MNLDEAENKIYNTDEIRKPVKFVSISEADKMSKEYFKPLDYDPRSKFSKGLSVGFGEISDIPDEVVLYGKRASLAIGGYFGDTPEEVENKKQSLITAERNLLEAKRNRMIKNKVDEDVSESLSFMIGSNLPTFASMLVGAGGAYRVTKAIGTGQKALQAAKVTGLAQNFVYEAAGEVAKKTPVISRTDERVKRGEAKPGDLDIAKISQEWALKSSLDVPLYGYVSTVLEAKAGFGEQLNIWNTPIKLGGTTKNIIARALAKTGITAASEGGTELLQSLSSTGINLIDGTITPKELPEELQEAIMSGIVGGIMGTAAGGSVSLKQARNAISMIKQTVEPVVGKEKAQELAEEIFNDADLSLSNIIKREMEIDSQLKNKHGNIMNSMLAAVSREMEGKPRFEAMTEDERAHLANVYAKGFADNILAEANFRNTTLDAVLSASDITYDNGLRIARKINIFDAIKNPEMIPPEAKQKRESLLAFIKRNGGIQDIGGDVKNMGALKQYPGLINKNGITLDDMALSAWENGYFPEFSERPDINTLLEAIDEGLRGNHRYNEEEAQTFSDVIENYKQELDREGIDWENMTAAEIEQAVDEIPDMKSLMREAEFYEQNDFDFEYAATGMNEDERESYLERIAMQMYQLADENAQLDAENPAYEGETININGQEKTVYNSNGDRIAKSKEALENFYKWFGDSKVVDEQGRPLVVYHGTYAEFDTFNKNMVSNYSAYSKNFYFTENKQRATDYGNKILSVYLKSDNLFDVELNLPTREDIEKINTILAKDGLKLEGDYGFDGMYMTGENFLNDLGVMTEQDYDYLLKEIGYDGIKSKDEFIVFDPNQIKSTSNRGTYSESENIYYQGAQSPKGMTTVTPDAYIIKLLEGADESTLPHELAHYWLSEMWNYVRSGRASEKYMQRWDNIAKYLNIRPEQTRLTQTQQEKFASSYEAYITRGNLPTPLIGSAFDDYDKWLQRVYNDYNNINYHVKRGNKVYSHPVRLTDAAVKFFQSMTTGTLEAPALAPKDTGVKLEEKPVEAKEVLEPKNEIVAEPTISDTTLVTNGDKGVSKVYKRGALLHPEAVSQPGLAYDKMHLDEQALAAKELVEKDLNKAREIIGGEKNETGKLTRTAVMQAYENEMLRIGNLDEYDRVRKIHSYEQTQRGQEIAAERIETDDVTNPTYWLEIAEQNLANQVAEKLFKGKEKLKQLNDTIKEETDKLYEQIKGKTVEEQQKIMRETAEKLQKEYGLETLYQMPDEINRHQLNSFMKSVFGINLERETRNDIINKSEQVRKLWKNTMEKGGNPSVEAMKAKRELNDLINSKTPSNGLAIWTSNFGRSAMLLSVKSPNLNIISNTVTGFTEAIVRRLSLGTTEKAVDKSVKQEFSKYAWEVYKASSDIVTTMNDYNDDMRIIGEQIIHSQGQGRFRAASRKIEEVSFKYLMGAPDVFYKTLAFNDTADLLATKIAREEGAKDISKRATEIYKDAILIRPQTEQGKKVRKQAQEEAHYTTFTNDSWAAKFGLSARKWLNMVGRDKVRLGDITMKFVKTPANVSMVGLEYGFGLLYTAYNIQEIIKHPQSITSQRSIKAAFRNGLGIALTLLIYSMLDPDDYFSEFDTLNPKEKDRMKALNAMPNSIKIGNKWVSLDYFGQLAIPLVGILEAKRNNSFRSYIQSGFTQAAKIPGIKETKQLIDSMSEYARYDLPAEKIVQMMAGTVLDQARAMTIPAIFNDIAKMADDYERDTMGHTMDKVLATIPVLRQKGIPGIIEGLPERYGLQGIIRTEPALSTLLFGSRVKTGTEDKLVREVGKLSGKGEQPSISDVTKYGDLRLLSPEKKVRVRKEFYKQYNAETKKLISTRDYQNKSPEAKKKALNKVRSNVVKSLKQKYSNDIQREKRRR